MNRRKLIMVIDDVVDKKLTKEWIEKVRKVESCKCVEVRMSFGWDSKMKGWLGGPGT